jgi:hypothetical protein
MKNCSRKKKGVTKEMNKMILTLELDLTRDQNNQSDQIQQRLGNATSTKILEYQILGTNVLAVTDADITTSFI